MGNDFSAMDNIFCLRENLFCLGRDQRTLLQDNREGGGQNVMQGLEQNHIKVQ